jgi:hypothetical protein
MQTRSLAIALIVFPASLRGQSDARVKAQMAIVGLDINSAGIVSYCESGAPAAAPGLRTAWQAWRVRNRVNDITNSIEGATLQKTRDAMSSTVAAARQKLASAGPPATVCPQLVGMWSSAEFDVQRSYAAAYETRADVASRSVATPTVATAPVTPPTVTPPSVTPPSVTTPVSRETPAATAPEAAAGATGTAPRPRATFNETNYSPNTRPSGTVYTVAQLTPLISSWWGTPRSIVQARARAHDVGTLYIRGTVATRNGRRFVETSDGVFKSRMSVATGIDISAFDGQEITIEGTLDEVPSSLVFLRHSRVVRDPSGLRPSPLSQSEGLYRIKVTREQITAAAGRGLQSRDIHGMFYTAYGTTGVNGYEFREEMRLLMRDGWAYLRDDMAPADLDVAVSRRIEPQYWAHWRKVSGGLEVQRIGDDGQPDGGWVRLTGRLLPVWPADQRLNGSYTAASFYGSIALGGTYTKTTFAFTPDGRWERIGLSQSGSGSMAAQAPVGYTGSAASTSDGSGTKSSAGGGNASVSASSSSRRDDGARHRGTYRLDGMTIEMRTDDGTVTRSLCVPVDPKFEALYLFGRSFSRR